MVIKKEKRKEMMDLIFNKYGALILSRQQAAKILSISTSTLDRMKLQGSGPRWKKSGVANNAAVEYSLDSLVDYIIGVEDSKK